MPYRNYKESQGRGRTGWRSKNSRKQLIVSPMCPRLFWLGRCLHFPGGRCLRRNLLPFLGSDFGRPDSSDPVIVQVASPITDPLRCAVRISAWKGVDRSYCMVRTYTAFRTVTSSVGEVSLGSPLRVRAMRMRPRHVWESKISGRYCNPATPTPQAISFKGDAGDWIFHQAFTLLACTAAHPGSRPPPPCQRPSRTGFH